MKKLFTLLMLCITMTMVSQNGPYESSLDGSANFNCDVADWEGELNGCGEYQLGTCPGDTYSDGSPTIGEFNIYYITQDIAMEFKTLTLRNCELQLRDGAILYMIANSINLETDCDTEYTTQITPADQVMSFSTVDEYNLYMEVLSTTEFELFKREANKIYYTIEGKLLEKVSSENDLDTGLYIVVYQLEGRIESEVKVKK